jgi:hypothetical protein
MKEINKEQGLKEKKSYPFTRWINWLFLAGFILVLIYTYYRAEVFHEGNLGPYYIYAILSFMRCHIVSPIAISNSLPKMLPIDKWVTLCNYRPTDFQSGEL